jgi:hypothetical protein
VKWAPEIPLPAFRFESPLVGLIKTAKGYEGWYEPSTRNTWTVSLRLSTEELKKLDRVEANGERVHRARVIDNAIEMRGTGGSGTPMKWSVGL